MAEKVKKSAENELESFRKVILSMVEPAVRIAKSALKLRRPQKQDDGTIRKPTPIPSQSIGLAKYVLEQYAKLVMPRSDDDDESTVIDQATMNQMKEASKIFKEINEYHRTSLTLQRGGNGERY